MFKTFISIFAVSVVLLDPASGRAADSYVREGVTDVVNQFNDSRLSGKMFDAIENLIDAATEKLRDEGNAALAAEISRDWLRVAAMNRGQFGTLDLGDHAPLNRWLADTYAKIEARLTPRVCHLFRLDDLKVLNHSIPVVFHPRGWNGDSWDRAEYRKHFVPFSGAVTYWTINGTCKVLTSGLWSWACGTVSEIPRFAVEKWFAPGTSDRVYATATGAKRVREAPSMDHLEELLDRAEAELSRSGSIP